jgi:hypothetical protein
MVYVGQVTDPAVQMARILNDIYSGSGFRSYNIGHPGSGSSSTPKIRLKLKTYYENINEL